MRVLTRIIELAATPVSISPTQATDLKPDHLNSIIPAIPPDKNEKIIINCVTSWFRSIRLSPEQSRRNIAVNKVANVIPVSVSVPVRCVVRTRPFDNWVETELCIPIRKQRIRITLRFEDSECSNISYSEIPVSRSPSISSI